MLKLLRAGFSAMAIAALLGAPLVTVVTADYAYAKNDNGGGKGNGNAGGKGGGNKGGADKNDKSVGKGNLLKRAGNGSARVGSSKKGGKFKTDLKTLSRNVKENGLAGLFSKKSGTTRTTKKYRSTKTRTAAPINSARPPKRLSRFDTDATAPNKMGKLNGAHNSSPQAKAAHIANGQYLKGTGPVSLAANLAVADYYFNDLMGEDNTLSPGDVKSIDDAFDLRDTSDLTLEEAQTVLNDPNSSPDELEEAQDVKNAYDLTTDADGEDIDRPTSEQVDAATTVHDAEDGLLEHYKGDFSEDEDLAMEQRDDVLGSVRESNPDDGAIESALERNGTGEQDFEQATPDSVTDDPEDSTDDEAEAAQLLEDEASEPGKT